MSLKISDLPAKVVTELLKRAERIKASLKRSLVEVGHELNEAKKVLKHGQFVAWVEAETGLTIRTAQLIMGAYKLVIKNENFSHLPRSALFILGAADVPAATIRAVEKQIAAGKTPSYTEVRQLVDMAKIHRPSPVNLALKVNQEMEEGPSKGEVIDLQTHRVMAETQAFLDAAHYHELQGDGQILREQIRIADIALMLSEILDIGQRIRLVTMIRNSAKDATLDELANALETVDA